MKHANINITSPKGPMKYYIEYVNDADVVSDVLRFRRDPDSNCVCFYDTNTNIRRIGNEWYQDTLAWAQIDNDGLILGEEPYDAIESPYGVGSKLPAILCSTPVPSNYHISTLKLYFPRFSVETYETNVKYALTVSTWIHGNEVVLGQYLIDRNDALAAENVKKFANEEYYEYIQFQIVDPWYLTYDDEWRQFRQVWCGEEEDKYGYEYNTTGSVLNITLHPVCKTGVDMHYKENHECDIYTEMDNYHGGQNAINLADEVTDYLDFRIEDNRNQQSYYESRMLIGTELNYNKAYSKDIYGLDLYLHETYQIDEYTLNMEIIIQDDENVYSYYRTEVENPWQEFDVHELCDENGNYPLLFDSWKGFKEGMYINIILNIVDSENPDTSIYLKSNKIALTYDLFRYLISDQTSFVVKETEQEPAITLNGNEITINTLSLNYGDVLCDGMNGVVELDNIEIQIDDDYISYGPIAVNKHTGELYWNGNLYDFNPEESNVVYEQIKLTNITKELLPLGGVTYVAHFVYAQQIEVTIREYEICIGDLKVELNHVYNEDEGITEYSIQKVEIADNVFYFIKSESSYYTMFGGLSISITGGKVYVGDKEYIPHNNIIKLHKLGLNKIYLESVDMKNYTINAVNKVQQNVVKMNRPDDYKANIIKPIFFRTYELGKLVIHPEVIEQICINLDQYKSKVDRFVLRIEGVVFTEYARNNSGVIFKIIGPSLPGKIGQGTYYILNQDNELITTGQYIYER